MSQNNEASEAPISADDRIRELNVLDMEIVQMLGAIGRAVQAMSAMADNPLPLDERRRVFQQNVDEAISRLHVIDVGTRRSIYALSEAGIIQKEPRTAMAKAANSLVANLDVSILNSQNDKVGKDMEADQWAKVREVLEKLQETALYGSKAE